VIFEVPDRSKAATHAEAQEAEHEDSDTDGKNYFKNGVIIVLEVIIGLFSVKEGVVVTNPAVD
jgi:hypothetical protein